MDLGVDRSLDVIFASIELNRTNVNCIQYISGIHFYAPSKLRKK